MSSHWVKISGLVFAALLFGFLAGFLVYGILSSGLDQQSVISLLGSFITTVAAGSSAVSARAALRNLEENRAARVQLARPILAVEFESDFVWIGWAPHKGTILVRRAKPTGHRIDAAQRPAFKVINFGGGAALDVTATFAVEGAETPIEVPVEFQNWTGATGRLSATRWGPRSIKLAYSGQSTLLHITRQTKGFLPHVGQGESRALRMTDGLANFLLYDGMRGNFGALELLGSAVDRKVTITLEYKTLGGESLSHSQVFQFFGDLSPMLDSDRGGSTASGADLEVYLRVRPLPREAAVVAS